MVDRAKDIVRKRLWFLAFWVFPAGAMFAVTSGGFGPERIGQVWIIALLIMSAGCFINAFRSGRLHCALTGPFFLLMAVTTLLYRLELIPLGNAGFELIGAITIVGAIALTYLPERIWGTYLKR